MIDYFYSTLKQILYQPGILDILYVAEGYGGVFLSACQQLYLKNNKFIENANYFAGVGYLMPHDINIESFILIENCLFNQNSAGEIGGVLYFHANFVKLLANVSNNTFSNNIAKSIYFCLKIIIFINFFFENNN